MPDMWGLIFGALLVLVAAAAVAGGFVIVNPDQNADDDGSPFSFKGALDRVVITLTDTSGAHSAPEEIID